MCQKGTRRLCNGAYQNILGLNCLFVQSFDVLLADLLFFDGSHKLLLQVLVRLGQGRYLAVCNIAFATEFKDLVLGVIALLHQLLNLHCDSITKSAWASAPTSGLAELVTIYTRREKFNRTPILLLGDFCDFEFTPAGPSQQEVNLYRRCGAEVLP